jgi:hypothetical protein
MPRKLQHHDLLVQRILSQPENAIAHLRSILPQAVLDIIQLDQLNLEDKSFVDDKLRNRQSDALYSVPIRGQPGFVYVLREHQSKSKPLMGLRLLGYMVRIWETYVHAHPKAKTLPVIVPVVLYHHKRRWKRATTFHSHFAAKVLAEPALAAVTPSYRFVLDDISEATDEELQARPMPVVARLALWVLRDARFDRLESTLPAWSQLLATLLGLPGGRQAVGTLFCYIYSVRGQGSAESLLQKIPDPEVREAAMTIAQQLEQRGRKLGRQEGLQEGRREGRVEVVLRLLDVKFGPLDEPVRARIADSDPATLDRYLERIVSATSLGEVLQDDAR